MCMKINPNGDRQLAVSGQVGKNPAVFVWDTTTGEKRARVQLAKNSRAVAACAISVDGNYIATADKSNDHIVTIFEVGSGSAVYSDKGGPDPIHDLAFAGDGSGQVWSAGVKAMMLFKFQESSQKKVLLNGHDSTSYACVTADDQGQAYAGAANSLIYVVAGNSTK